MSNQRGFTLVELLLSISIITLLVGLSVPVYATFIGRNDLDLTAQSLITALRRAQTYARAVEGDSAWGVAILSDKVVLFKGASYATRDAAFDEIMPLTSTITNSGGEIVYAKLSGTPSTTISTTFTQTTTNDSRTVTLNAKGMVE